MRRLSLNVKTAPGMDPKRRGRKRRRPARRTRQSDPPTWGQLKKLVAQAQKLVTAQRTPFTPMTVFLAVLAVLSSSAQADDLYWAYVPDHPFATTCFLD